MKKLQFDYYMQIDYSKEVSRCNFTIKCIPKHTKRQRVLEQKIELYPATHYSEGVDGFQNSQIYGLNEVPHKTFWFHTSGVVETGLAEFEELENDSLTMIFRHPFGLNKPSEKIVSYHKQILEKLANARMDHLAMAKEIMHCLHRDFSYVPNTTTVKTTAEEAYELGHGVCQDYAHIFIALLHLSEIPARYVTGLIVGEGASHAWVEVYEAGKWYGFDPTNDIEVTEDHIKIGIGRDAHDCMINRGIMHGGGLHTQIVRVNVQEVE